MKVQILNYVGIYNNMIIALYSLTLNGKNYEGTVIYNDKKYEIDIEESFLEQNHIQLKYHAKYNDFVLKLLTDLIPYHSHIKEGKLQIFTEKSW
jgi:hypothetical protein